MENLFDREPKLEDFQARHVDKPEIKSLNSVPIDEGFWGNPNKKVASIVIGAVMYILFELVVMFIIDPNHEPTDVVTLVLCFTLFPILYGLILAIPIRLILGAISGVVLARKRKAQQAICYQADLHTYERELQKAEEERISEFNYAHRQWEEKQARIRKAQEENQARIKKEQEEIALAQQRDRTLKAQIIREEAQADEKMSRSSLVIEIAKCILPFYKRIVDQADREGHIKVRVRLGIKVNKNSIEYYDVANPKNVSLFSFSEEGISDQLSPIYRKALCKTLVTELRRLLFETYSADSSGQKIQIGLEGTVTLVSQIKYILGRDDTAPEYDDNSYAEAILLYETFEQKVERHF